MSNHGVFRSTSSSSGEPARSVLELFRSLLIALGCLVVLVVYSTWWTYSRILGDLDTRGVSSRGAYVRISETVNTVTVVAMVLVVLLPLIAWFLRRSSWWIPVAITALAMVTTGILNRDEVALIHSLVPVGG
ncbi:hypothetical protein [Sanguibacter antarcticus]|uniref:Uncharacterized protein n=1 Tax=Sanguibacter antarcticus TaxID=372484 RepID=A0A2A9E4C5_9MICO|nr:hypothetical protein [Sanguibacter antarcticus]PFG33039.1 hypothetical protein ATL42_0891 [Sanguibacter antarcticus]